MINAHSTMGFSEAPSLSSVLQKFEDHTCLECGENLFCDVGSLCWDTTSREIKSGESNPSHDISSPKLATTHCYSTIDSDRKHITRKISRGLLKSREPSPDVVADERGQEPVKISSRPIHASWQDIENKQALRKFPIRNIQGVSDHNEHSNVESAAGSTVCSERSTTTEHSSPATLFSTLNTSRKSRPRDDGASPSPGDKDDRVPKRPKYRSDPEPETSLRLACPYYKRDPRKYNIHVHRVCASRHWDSVSRVKEHLYRCHMASAYCPRCKKLFDTDEDVRTHLVDPEPCSFKQGDPPDGISVSMQKALKSRKATSQNLPQPERWKEIYRMLFPGHDVPEPWFGPVQGLIDLDDFEAYFQQELPKVVRSHFHTSAEQPSNVDILVSQTVDTVQDYHDQVLSNYRSQLASESMTFRTDNGTSAISSRSHILSPMESSTTLCASSELAYDSKVGEVEFWNSEAYPHLKVFTPWNSSEIQVEDAWHEMSW